MLTLIKRPNLVSAVFNPMEFKFSMSNYSIGDRFYIDIYHATGYLYASLDTNGDGLGTATFDISGVLENMFSGVSELDENAPYQIDHSAMAGYVIRAGRQTISGASIVKTQYYQSDMLFAVRAALPLDTDASLEQHIVASGSEASFLTLNSAVQPKGSNIWLPLILAGNCSIRYCASTNLSGTPTVSFDIEGHVGYFVFNAKPEVLGFLSDSTGYTVWVELVQPMFRATRDYTAICGESYSGRFTATASGFSSISQTDANTKALQAAQTLANSLLVCTPLNQG